MSRRLAAEALGSLFLLMAVVGSGIMAERLAGGNAALTLLTNTLVTAAALTVLIAILAPISGAHFNPAVTLCAAVHREIAPRQAAAYAASQIAGAVLGVFAAHAMFAAPILEVASRLRDGPSQWFSEFVATFGLILTIRGAGRFRPSAVPALVGLYIAAAYWFTASTAFANPAVTLARMLTDSFSGIAPASAPAFIAAQLGGALAAQALSSWLFASGKIPNHTPEAIY